MARVFGFDGEPIENCACPVCVDLAARGIPIFDELGREVPPPKDVTMIDVRIRGTASTCPEIDTSPQTISVPQGCLLQDLLAYLGWLDRAVYAAFPPGGLTAVVNGQPAALSLALTGGDDVVLSGIRDRLWTDLVSQLVPVAPEPLARAPRNRV